MVPQETLSTPVIHFPLAGPSLLNYPAALTLPASGRERKHLICDELASSQTGIDTASTPPCIPNCALSPYQVLPVGQNYNYLIAQQKLLPLN